MKYQAKAPDPIPMTDAAFENSHDTAVYWLTGAGIMLNSHGTTIMVDPVISLASENPPISEVEEAPQYCMPPILAKDVKKLDAVLYTHADTDHMGTLTVNELKKLDLKFHGTPYVKMKLMELGVPEEQIVAHGLLDEFDIGDVHVKMTLADHPWQLDYPETQPYVHKLEDCCGFKFYTRDGVVWHPGDSKYLPEHLDNEDVDLMFMDFEDNKPIHHFGTELALKIVNTLKDSEVIMFHWGTYYDPDKCWYAADPAMVRDKIENLDRFLEPHPGEKVLVHPVVRKK